MNNDDQILSELRTNVARKNHLNSILSEMQNQKVFLVEKVETLKASKLKEDKDVEKMENGSLASFFYNVVGKKDQKLDKERKEAYEATVKYDLAVSELYALEGDIASMERELRELAHCEEEYQEALKRKLHYIKDTDPELGARVQDMEEAFDYLENHK